MEFASSLKVLGWFVQMLSDKSLTATLQRSGVIADKPDLCEALESLLDELDRVQTMLSLAQNFGSQHKGLLEFLKDLMDAAYEADDLLSEADYYRLEQEVNASTPKYYKASTSPIPPSFHDINKATMVPRIHEIVSRLKSLVTCLRKALSLLQPEDDFRANPNVFPVAGHPLTTSFLLSNQTMFLPSLYHDYRFDVSAEDEFLAMFNKCAFGGEDPSDHLELDEIAKQIAGKLEGSLLAATVVGGLLRDNLDEQHWRSVLCSDIWQQQKSPDDVMPILRFSYHHLPVHLQQCFAYCSVFPKDWKFQKENLVGMWISQGYIHTKSRWNMSLEEIGSEYFDNLLSKSFIQASRQYITRKTYVLHDLLHDLAESISEGEYLRINWMETKEITSRVRHLHAHSSNLGLLKSCNLRNLRTLIIHGNIIDDYNVLKEVLNGLKSIRVLCLNVSVEFLSGSIGDLIHLRYLTIKTSIGHLIHLQYLTAKNNDQSMPHDSQCRPYHLQWLIFDGDSHIVLPAASNYLVSLRHCLSMGDGIGKTRIGMMTCLQELESFMVGKNEGQKLAELKRLNKLGGTLRLGSLDNVSSKEEALEANLNKKVGIRELTLNCYRGHATPQMAEEVFEGLRPPPYIKHLNLEYYLGVESPTWMKTVNCCLSVLQSLTLYNSFKWKVLPPLGQLPLLRCLEICGAHAVEEIGSSFYGSGGAKSFPCLEMLKFRYMRGWVVWSGVKEDSSLFPRLCELTVTGCPKLKRVPMQCLTSVEVLQTNCMVLLAEPESLTSLKKLNLEDFRTIQSLPLLPASLVTLEIKYWRQQPLHFTVEMKLGIYECRQPVSVELKSLTSLKNLQLEWCERIQSVPFLPATLVELDMVSLPMLTAFSKEQEENLSDLTSLRKMRIHNCPHLQSLPLMPASLQHLHIQGCPGLPRDRYRKGGDDWHKVSHVPHFTFRIAAQQLYTVKGEMTDTSSSSPWEMTDTSSSSRWDTSSSSPWDTSSPWEMTATTSSLAYPSEQKKKKWFPQKKKKSFSHVTRILR